ncbi:EH domain-containing protein 1-like [Pyrus ussuriensis x Pyrus communis]|uniref:EH domain-containing protein 1-like n=1 Tax=Pyrus ussuriensis x Pyrus communis TaxID=2448454 RepID=A0A5N5GJ85_9ROSA|nr:EH domain-containing protein 1-like [Pyrus ussuriensis x Pyrus communis]
MEGLDALLLAVPLSSVTSIIDGLKRLYVQKLKPLEVTYKFNDFVSPLLRNSDFDAKPMVMLLGQYSTGKTTFIKHLLKRAHIGPEPTTDRFVVVMSGPDERSVPGNTIAVQADMPFSGLTTFGTAFLSKFESAKIHAYIISHLRKEMPAMLGKSKAQRKLIDNLENEFKKREHHLPPGDFPNVDHYREILAGYSIDKLERLKPKMIDAVDEMLGYDIPELLKKFRNPYD